MKYKIIDFEYYGNVIKLFLGHENILDWTGDDWDNDILDSYDPVHSEFILRTILLVINPDKFIVRWFDELPIQNFTKNDMKTNKFPFMSITKPDQDFWSAEAHRYCLGDVIEIKDKIKFIPIGL